MAAMSQTDLLSLIDSEIARIEQARNLLTGSGASKRGRKPATKTANKPKRTMSAAARKRIAAAQRKRWAAQKSTAQ